MSLVYSQPKEIGWEAPDFTLKGIDEKNHSLKDYLDQKGLLIVFTCNHCPYAQAAWPEIIKLYEGYREEIHFIAINPNDPNRYEEDSFEGMKKLAKEMNVEFDYLVDETQEVAKAYDAQPTPDPYLFKVTEGKTSLFYHGRVNDNWENPEEATKEDLKDALEKLVNEQEPDTNQAPSMGCSIKWK